jgi:hypothetical protein
VAAHRYLSPAAAGGALLAGLVFLGCGHTPTMPTPTPDPTLQVTPIDNTGPIRITFVTANIPPGSTVGGCGSVIEGCAGKLRMTFRLNPPSDGPVLFVRMFLHATNLQACLWGELAPFSVQAGAPITIELSADRPDRCGTPTTIATMAVVVEGPIQVSSRQTWSLRYTFAP